MLGDLNEIQFNHLKKDPKFLKKFSNIIKNNSLSEHTFIGHLTSSIGIDGITRYKISGIHSSKAFLNGITRIKPGTQVENLGDGFYKPKIEKQIDGFVNDQNTNWKVKADKSTFFPDYWSIEKIQAEIAFALKNIVQKMGNK